MLIHRINRGDEYYVFPGGGVEENEKVEDAVLREVKEETSLSVEIKKLLYHENHSDGTEQFFFLCEYLSGHPKLGDFNESQEMKNGGKNFFDPVWYDIEKIKNLILYPLTIRDYVLRDYKNNFDTVFEEDFIEISK